MKYDITIIGGFGHVGLPLGIVFADKGLKVCLYDIDRAKADSIARGEMPFVEYGAEPILKKSLANGNLVTSVDPQDISNAQHVIVAIGTPIDEYLNPKINQFLDALADVKKYLHPNQLIIIRSTVYPRTSHLLDEQLRGPGGIPMKIAYCPERIVQGHSVRELGELPQIVAGLSPEAENEAAALFAKISPKIIRTNLREAELIKLFANSWRYIQFAVANQFYMIATNFGEDYNSIRKALTDGYGRAAALPSAGFTAGPCLLKDTMQLAAFNSNNFMLGHAAMMINEGLPNFIVEGLSKQYDLSQMTVGVLGMAFKADIDDIRDSLSYKICKILRMYHAEILCSDEFVRDASFVSKEELMERCDMIILGVPHSAYKNLVFRDDCIVVDIWGATSATNARIANHAS